MTQTGRREFLIRTLLEGHGKVLDVGLPTLITKECAFVMWKNDRFFEERKTAFSAKIAAALLKSGKANVKKLYSPKTGKTYDGTIVLADTGGKYVNYRIEVQKN